MRIKKSDEKKIKKQLVESLENYRKIMTIMSSDAPIGVLCLPKAIETILCENGITRVYEVLNCDLTKIKGLGAVRRGQLTTRLDEFIHMC